jgi:hypothetical protein
MIAEFDLSFSANTIGGSTPEMFLPESDPQALESTTMIKGMIFFIVESRRKVTRSR